MKKIFILCLLWNILCANPQEYKIVTGNVDFGGSNRDLEITCSDRSIIEWGDFSILKGESTRFIQPNEQALVLNRVLGRDGAHIAGKLSSNGHLLLISPAGIFLDKSCVIDTAAFVGSTQDILNEMIISGDEWIFKGNSSAAICNLGKITARNGDLYLFAHKIINEGNLSAPRGLCGCGAGSEIWLKPYEKGHFYVRAIQAEDDQIDQRGEIQALSIALQTSSPFQYAVKASGELNALETLESQGRIYLVADKGALVVDGKLKASGGQIELLGESVVVQEGAQISVASDRVSGSIWIGGHLPEEGEGRICNHFTGIGPKTYIETRGLGKASAGTLMIWSDEMTLMEGEVNARGGDEGGNGGFVEVSALKNLSYRGRCDRRAPFGKSGKLFLDPEANITIDAGPTNGGSFAGVNPITFTPVAAFPTIAVADLVSELGMGDVEILTNGGSVPAGQLGIVTISQPITWSDQTTLSITAGAGIVVSAEISNTFSGAPFDALVFNVNQGVTPISSSSAGISISADITTQDGSIIMNALSGDIGTTVGISINGATVMSANGDIRLTGTSAGSGSSHGIVINNSTIASTGNGAISLIGEGSAMATDDSRGIFLSLNSAITSQDGSVTLSGTGNGTGFGNSGVYCMQSSAISISGSGNLSITGVGSSQGTGTNNMGFEMLSASSLAVTDGKMTINGTGGAGGDGQYGIYFNTVTLSSTGTLAGAPLSTLRGVGGSGSQQNEGFYLDNVTFNTQTAPFSFTGIGGGSANFNNGVHIIGGDFTSHQGGNLFFTGTAAGTSGASGIIMEANPTITTQSSGDLRFISNLAATTGSANIGISINTATISSTSALANAGRLLFIGRGGTGTSGNGGILVNGSDIESVSGSIDITGIAKSDYGIKIQSSNITSTGTDANAATITLTGHGGSDQSAGVGIYLSGGTGSIDSQVGNITLFGFGGNNGAGNVGISNDGNAAKIRSLDSASILLSGQGGLGTHNNIGVLLTEGSITTVDGEISITGNGAGSGTGNHGISLKTGAPSIDSSGTGNIFLNGNSSAQGPWSYGIEMEGGAQITAASSANISLRGLVQNSSLLSKGIFIRDTSTGVTGTDGRVTLLGEISTTGQVGIALDNFARIATDGPIDVTSEGSFDITSSATVEGGLGTIEIMTGGDLTITAGTTSDTTGLLLGTGNATLSIGGDLILHGNLGNGSSARIGAVSADSSATITFSSIGGSVTLDPIYPDSFTVIGHGAPGLTTPTLSGDLIFNLIHGDLNLIAATGAGALYGFSQIGHLDSPGSTLSGDIFITANGSISLEGGPLSLAAYAQIGHGGLLNNPTLGPSSIEVKAGRNMSILSGSGDAAVVTGDGAITLVVDNLFPSAPEIGPGRFVFGSTLSCPGELRIYTASPDQNTINGLINGELFIPGPAGENTPQEEYAAYFPEGTYSTAAFRFYYKVGSPSTTAFAIYDLQVAEAQLSDLVPLFGSHRIPGNLLYHTRLCLLNQEFSCMPLLDPYGYQRAMGDDMIWIE